MDAERPGSNDALTPVTPAPAPPPAMSESPPFPVVGIGASAGGLEALERFFQALAPDTAMAFVVVQHLSPDYKSLMVELLSKHTTMKVCRAEDEMTVEPRVVYLLPPKKNVVIHGLKLKLADRPGGQGIPLPIDIFFSSLAETCGEKAVGVILSGTGSDGTRGVREIKAAGGAVLVQEETSAKFDGMPRAAISTGLVDAVLLPEQMPAHLTQLVRHASDAEARLPLDPESSEIADDYSRVLTLLRHHTGVDFALYKPATILRRIERRMGLNGIHSLSEYARVASETPREVATLYKELLIGVTRFFRDADAFELLRSTVIPEIIEGARWDQQVRVWVPGCSTGEEAYSIGMLFLEQMEKLGKRLDLKIFATDIDRTAIEYASAGVYPESVAADVSGERLNRFFVPRGDSHQVARELRGLVLFAVHNLAHDPPFTRVHLVSCRNLLIYMQPQLQQRVLSLFHYAVIPDRFLLLGPSETVGELTEQFKLVDPKWKLFRVTAAPRVHLTEAIAFSGPHERRRAPASFDDAGESAEEAYRWLISEFAPPAVQVTESLDLVHVFGDCSRYLALPSGRASLRVLELLTEPLAGAVSTAIHQATQQRKEIRYGGVRVSTAGAEQVLLRVVPVPGRRGQRSTYLVVFQPVDAPRLLAPGKDDLDGAMEARLVDLQAELQGTKENLQATIEELETSNEELQATNEELLSSNEELQSTNEELQSVNEELHTVNTEYQSKIQELSELNTDLDNLLRGSSSGTLFLDEHLAIRRFTPAVSDLISVIPRDVGRSIEHFTLNFELPGFVELLRRTLATGVAAEQEVATHDGRRFLMRLMSYVGGSPQRGVVVTFIDVSALWLERARLQGIIDSHPGRIAVLDQQGIIVLANAAWRTQGAPLLAASLGASEIGAPYLELCDRASEAGRPAAQRVRAALIDVLHHRARERHVEYREATDGPDSATRAYLLSVSVLPGDTGGVVLSHLDVTERGGHPGVMAGKEGA